MVNDLSKITIHYSPLTIRHSPKQTNT